MPGNVAWLIADATRMAKILSNLLNNADKYTPLGGQVELVAEVVDGEVVVRIVANGIGIPPEMLPKILGLFPQVDGAAERFQVGLGVGLDLSRKLAEMHGERIEAASPGPKGCGLAFNLHLPVASSAAALTGVAH